MKVNKNIATKLLQQAIVRIYFPLIFDSNRSGP